MHLYKFYAVGETVLRLRTRKNALQNTKISSLQIPCSPAVHNSLCEPKLLILHNYLDLVQSMIDTESTNLFLRWFFKNEQQTNN